ncbi:ABC transporter ATP-binding protein [Streptomyces sp. NPDC005970]|uniref:ABC transporter ATP-binding protein n=1 Tax=Streptomyces sp. NPDC005970 TaxID=3156723 RepID=UPI0033D1930E
MTTSYGGFTAIDDVHLEVGAGEFVALLGPSGSGKTTLLMSVAGFETPSGGRILVDGDDVTRLPPHRRGFGIVFQRYALFPHLSVARNVEYPLRMRGLPRAERRRAVREALDLVDLGPFAERRPHQLSGGQQQRVALARALVFRPPVLLMDEPLGALDRKLREQVQLEIRRLHRELGTTVLYVTHDQDEALVMADRIAVLKDGRIEQYDTPTGMYEAPASEFVAGFLGRTNVIAAKVVSGGPGRATVAVADRELPALVPADAEPPAPGAEVSLAVRPERIALADKPSDTSLPATVSEVIFSGATTSVVCETVGAQLAVELLSDGRTGRLQVGDTVHLSWGADAARLFPRRP